MIAARECYAPSRNSLITNATNVSGAVSFVHAPFRNGLQLACICKPFRILGAPLGFSFSQYRVTQHRLDRMAGCIVLSSRRGPSSNAQPSRQNFSHAAVSHIWHSAKPLSSRICGGFVVLQISAHFEQRGWKLHPEGRSRGLG